MPDKPKIDPDAAVESCRKYIRICEEMGEYVTTPDSLLNQGRHHLALIDAAREMANTYRAEAQMDECIPVEPLLTLEALLPIQDTTLEGIVQDAVASNRKENKDG